MDDVGWEAKLQMVDKLVLCRAKKDQTLYAEYYPA